eukprot:2403984-Pleurochrysis_carterae.AAC.1
MRQRLTCGWHGVTAALQAGDAEERSVSGNFFGQKSRAVCMEDAPRGSAVLEDEVYGTRCIALTRASGVPSFESICLLRTAACALARSSFINRSRQLSSWSTVVRSPIRGGAWPARQQSRCSAMLRRARQRTAQ